MLRVAIAGFGVVGKRRKECLAKPARKCGCGL